MCYLLDGGIALISTRAGLQMPWPMGPKAGLLPLHPPPQSALPQAGKVSHEQTTFFTAASMSTNESKRADLGVTNRF